MISDAFIWYDESLAVGIRIVAKVIAIYEMRATVHDNNHIKDTLYKMC